MYVCTYDILNIYILETFELNVKQGKMYLLRMVNAALNNNLFFKIANHKFTVVAVDAAYTEHYVTDVIAIAAGQSADVLFTADQPADSYYMAASPYVVGEPVPLFNNKTTRGIVVYDGYKETPSSSSKPLMPTLPLFNDTPTAHKFFSNITGLEGGPHWVPIPLEVNGVLIFEHLLFFNINLIHLFLFISLFLIASFIYHIYHKSLFCSYLFL